MLFMVARESRARVAFARGLFELDIPVLLSADRAGGLLPAAARAEERVPARRQPGVLRRRRRRVRRGHAGLDRAQLRLWSGAARAAPPEADPGNRRRAQSLDPDLFQVRPLSPRQP